MRTGTSYLAMTMARPDVPGILIMRVCAVLGIDTNTVTQMALEMLAKRREMVDA